MPGESTQDLFDLAATLSDDRALEAVNLLAGVCLATASDADVRDSAAGSLGISSGRLEQAVRSATAAETADLARLVLTAYLDAGSVAQVERAIADTGQRALLLEIAVIGVLALGLLDRAGVRGSNGTQEFTLSSPADGQLAITTSQRVWRYTVGQSVAPLVVRLLSAGRAGNGG